MTDITSIFGGAYEPNKYVEPPEVQLADAMRAAGLDPPSNIRIDGQLHRFSTKGRKKDDSGWYVAFPEPPVAGRFGCWRDQIDVVFHAEMERQFTSDELMIIQKRQSEARHRRDEERERKATVAASTVYKIWSEASAAHEEHPYLVKKGIKSHGARVTGDGRLIVPLYGEDGNLSSLQYIGEDEKRYHPGGTTKGCSWVLGDIDNGTIFVAEGYATAATINEVSNRPVVIAFSANNLPEVVRQLREKFGVKQDIVVVADNDASGVGQNKADEASAKYGARVVMPPVEGDANDYVQAGYNLMELLFPPADDWLVPADEFASQPSPIKWLIKKWLQRDALIMVHGPSGGGKTFLVLDMCLSVASGGDIDQWFGQRVRHAPVIYLAGEGHHGLRGRVSAWMQDKKVPHLDMWLSKHGLDLNTPQGYQKTVEAIRALNINPGIIVVDTLHRFLQGDENKAQDTKTMLDACSSLIDEFTCSVLLVHHTGVSEDAQHRARGSSAWKGALDIEISVVPGETIEIVQRKSKDTELAQPMYSQIKPVTINGWIDEDGDPVTSAVMQQTDQPSEPPKETAISKHQKTWEAAWWHSGAEFKDGVPFINRDQMVAFFIEQRGLTEATAKQYAKPTAAKRPICELLEAGIIGVSDDGWIMLDQNHQVALSIAKNGIR